MEAIYGTLEMLVLRTLVRAPLHGYGIAQALRAESEGRLRIEFGSLYPALKRIEAKGWVATEWVTSETKRRAKMYRLTALGRRQLRKEHSSWNEFAAAVARIMGPAPEGGAR